MLSPLRAGFVFAKLGANQKGLAAYADLTTTVSSGIGIRPSYAQFQPPYWQVPRSIEQHHMCRSFDSKWKSAPHRAESLDRRSGSTIDANAPERR
jgi:hypothetical protein